MKFIWKTLKATLSVLGTAGRATIALIGVCGVVAALANYTLTQGSGTTFGSIVVSTVHYAQTMICDVATPSQCTSVKPASTAAVATDTSLVTSENPNSALITAVNSATPAGTNIIGKVGIDQTTPGTTNGVQVNAALPAGTNLMGKVGIDQTTPGTTNAVVPSLATTGGMTTFFVQPAASDNHTNIKNGAGQVYYVLAMNNSATVNYLRFYNAATGFNGCNSATNLVTQIQIPASTSVGGVSIPLPFPIPFSTGISICVTSGYATNDTTNATASAMSLTVGYN